MLMLNVGSDYASDPPAKYEVVPLREISLS
jgi:hypothetical protein